MRGDGGNRPPLPGQILHRKGVEHCYEGKGKRHPMLKRVLCDAWMNTPEYDAVSLREDAHVLDQAYCHPRKGEKHVDKLVDWIIDNNAKATPYVPFTAGAMPAILEAHQGADFPTVYAPYAVGRWCVAQAQENRLHYRYDTETKAWYLATDTHWMNFDYEVVRGAYADLSLIHI